MNAITPRTGPGEGFLLQYDFATDSIPPLREQKALDPKQYQEPGGPKDWDQQPGTKPADTQPAQKQPSGGEPHKDWWQQG